MTQDRMEPAKIVAYVLLAINVLTLLYVGYICAENHAAHYGLWGIEPSRVGHLTVKEDVLTDSVSCQVPVPKGTVVYPVYLYKDGIGFYFKASGEYFRKYNKDPGLNEFIKDVPETEEYLVHAKPEQFVEYKELERMYKEAEEQARAVRSEMFRSAFIPFLIADILLLAALLFLTAVLSKKRWYVLLYVINAVTFFVTFFVITSYNLCH